jgi:2-polyprenyl-6-hydroxyphenyl methylase/3-demethylubiquinone-9 3-methyltransferase
MTADSTELSAHFAFGENWESYSKLIDAEKIIAAVNDLSEFVGPLPGRSFLDIGCGSGLSSLAALRLGAGPLVAIDIDPKSVETTRRVIAHHAPDQICLPQTISVLSGDFDGLGQFDVVYSWGVLHHTGQMKLAIERAAVKVKTGGLLALALYRKTPFCWAWRIEKWLYSRSPRVIQELLFWPYKLALNAFYFLRSRGRADRRGMDLDHDIRDWLGGYPYESATPAEIDSMVLPLGFRKVKQNLNRIRLWGIMGAGCSEYLYKRY